MRYQVQPFEDFAKEVDRLLRPPYHSHYRSVSWKDIGKKLVPPDWLVKGLLQANDVSILAGKQQSGKTFVGTEIALAVARGHAIGGFDKPERVTLDVPKQRGVVYIAAESARGVVQLRLPAYRQHHGLTDEDDLPFVVITQAVNFFAADADVNNLIRDIKHHADQWNVPLGLIVIDTFSAVTPGLDEVKGAEVSKVRERINRLRDAFRCHIQIVTHLNADGNKVRGHTSLTADIETVILCAQTDEQDIANGETSGPNIRELLIDKQKDGPAGLKFRFKLKVIELGTDEDGEPVTSCVCVPPEHIERMPSGREGLGMVSLSAKDAIVFRALVRALDNAGEDNPKDARSPFGATCVRIQHWSRELVALIQDDDEDEEKAKERAKKMRGRAFDRFIDQGLIGKDGQWVWRTKRRIKGFDKPYEQNVKKPAEDLPADVQKEIDGGELPFSF